MSRGGVTLAERILELLTKGTYTYRSLRNSLEGVGDGELDQALTQLVTAKRIKSVGEFYQVDRMWEPPAPAPPQPREETEEVPMSKTKVCRSCKAEKPSDQFPKTGKNARRCYACAEKEGAAPAPKKSPRRQQPKAPANGSGEILDGLRAHRERLQRSIDIVDQAIALLEADA